MTKKINETEQLIVAKIVEGFMDKFIDLAPLMALSPAKGAHLFNLGIASFVFTASKHLDEAHDSLKDQNGYTPLNMHGKTFDNHLDFFIHLLKDGEKKEFNKT